MMIETDSKEEKESKQLKEEKEYEEDFKFNKITAADGEFSLKYIFPNPDKYQVIAKIDSKNCALALALYQLRRFRANAIYILL
jgi:hypothetical protein